MAGQTRFGTAAGAVATMMAAMMLVAVPIASAHTSGGYRNEPTAAVDNSDWMAGLPDDLPISQLSIPGTHDTAAYNFGGESTETQSMNVAEQLEAGIRAWDMRLGVNDGIPDDFPCAGPELWTFHGISCQFQTFTGDILPAAESFLDSHPGETILMRVRHEHGSLDDFAATVEAEMDAFPGLLHDGGGSNPTLGDVRGKIVLLRNYSGSTRGIPWSALDIQDQFSVGDNWDLADKWGHVTNQFQASDDTATMHTTYVNFLSASGGSFPYFIASGHSSWETGAPRLWTGWTDGVIDSCASASQCLDEYPRLNCGAGTCSVYFEGINNLAMDHIGDSVDHRTGIVMADFPGPGLIDAIIDLNPWNLPPTPDAGGPYVTTENSSITFDASASTDPDGDQLQYRWDFDGDGIFETEFSDAATANHTFSDDFVGNAMVEVTDGFSPPTRATASVTVTNVAPTVTATASDVDENGITTLSGSISDPSPDDTFTLTIEWGEGEPEVVDLAAGTTSYAVAHQYLDDDPSGTPSDSYTLSVGIVDDDGGTGAASDAIVVSNLAPVVSLDTVTDETGADVGQGLRVVLTNTRVDMTASFTDVGTRDTHLASVEWGDGVGDDLGPSTGTTGGSHVYTSTGVFTVTITVVDDDGGTHSQSRDLAVVDAADALQTAADALQQLADDPTIPGHDHVQQAVNWLIGNAGGRANNGALDQLDRGNLHVALGALVTALEAAEDAGGTDLSAHESLLALAAKSIAVGATDQVESEASKANELAKVAAARAHIDAGTAQMVSSDHVGAATSFQLAVRAVQGRVR